MRLKHDIITTWHKQKYDIIIIRYKTQIVHNENQHETILNTQHIINYETTFKIWTIFKYET